MVKGSEEDAMKTKARRWVAANVVLVLAASGCDVVWSDVSGDCDLMLTCEHFLPTGSGGGPPNPGCEADPTQDASTVTDECAVFVSATAEAGGDGTKAKPYASLVEAVANAGNKRVLACTSGAFAESVAIEAGIEVIGGFDCKAEWTWSEEARSAIEGPAGAVALTMTEGASGAKVRSFAVRAASATELGGSSIGVAVADIDAELAQVEVTAGDGMDGENGTTPTEAPVAGASAEAMSASDACAATNLVIGGTAGATTCEDGETRGGDGGTGGITGTAEGNGQVGRDGEPMPEPNPSGKGIGGVGQVDPEGECEPGEPGKSGTASGPGSAGNGATLTLAGISGGDGGQQHRAGTTAEGGPQPDCGEPTCDLRAGHDRGGQAGDRVGLGVAVEVEQERLERVEHVDADPRREGRGQHGTHARPGLLPEAAAPDGWPSPGSSG